MPQDFDRPASASAQTVLGMRRPRRLPAIQIIAAPVYDLLMSLHVAFMTEELQDYDIDRAWVERARAACSPELLETLTLFFGNAEGQWFATKLFALLWEAPAISDTLATIDWLAERPIAQILVTLLDRDGLGDDWQDALTSIIMPTRKQDPATKIQAFARRFPASERSAVIRLLTSPQDEFARLVQAMRAWYHLVFAAEEGRIAPLLQQEGERMTKLQAELSPDKLFSKVIFGIAFDPPAAVDRIILAPSALIMPVIFHHEAGGVQTYCYPIKDLTHEATSGESVQRREMLRLFTALADDTRIRILYLLSKRTMYLTELSEHLHLTKATTRHHMVRLRAAGLVTLHVREKLNYYTINDETLDIPTTALRDYLTGKSDRLPKQSS